MVLQVEAPVHVVDARGDLVAVRDHPEEEGAAVGDDGLPDAVHAQRVAAELEERRIGERRGERRGEGGEEGRGS